MPFSSMLVAEVEALRRVVRSRHHHSGKKRLSRIRRGPAMHARPEKEVTPPAVRGDAGAPSGPVVGEEIELVLQRPEDLLHRRRRTAWEDFTDDRRPVTREGLRHARQDGILGCLRVDLDEIDSANVMRADEIVDRGHVDVDAARARSPATGSMKLRDRLELLGMQSGRWKNCACPDSPPTAHR